jgi:hypothetical protein
MNNTTAQLSDAKEALAFVLGGNSTFTAVSEKTEARYTFKVRIADSKDTYFVSLLTGSDNTSDFSYMGIIPTNSMEFRLTRKSAYNDDSTPVKAFRYVTNALKALEMPKSVAIWHEGKCGRCGRKLTVPESVASGFGPECITKVGIAA